ncbi:MAG: hypothetical protein J6S59_00105 [Clostridia bacterium]|nr:hypothetical protein [Clostridia bacterium]MBO6015562.1 hypothetical protein [Lachnospiraceae bacterium]
MAGIYIPDIEFPPSPWTGMVVLVVKDDGTACYTKAETLEQKTVKYTVIAEPHGRCIDADAVFKRLQKQAMSVWGNGNPRYQIILEVMDAIRFAPTIIPASEEGET